MYWRALVIAVVIVVVIVIIGSLATARYDGYLSGYWVGDPAFLEKANLKDIQLFIAPVVGGVRDGYLIMTDAAGEYLANQAVTIKTGGVLSAPGRWLGAIRDSFVTAHDQYSFPAEIEYDNGSSPGSATPMPTSVRMTLSILDGTLTIYDDGKVWALLNRDPAATGPALTAYEHQK